MIKSNFVLSAKKVVIGMVPLTVSIRLSVQHCYFKIFCLQLPTTVTRRVARNLQWGAVLGVSQPSEAGGLGALPPGLKSIVFF